MADWRFDFTLTDGTPGLLIDLRVDVPTMMLLEELLEDSPASRGRDVEGQMGEAGSED